MDRARPGRFQASRLHIYRWCVQLAGQVDVFGRMKKQE
jgi:hypothetical protein